jgi:hypothetical protein
MFGGVDDKVAAAAVAMVENALEVNNVRGDFTMRPRTKAKMRGGGVRFSHPVGQAVRVKARPNGNDSAWEYDLVCPSHIDAGLLVEKLTQRQQPEEPESKETPQSVAEEPAPAAPAVSLDDTIKAARAVSASLATFADRREERKQKMDELDARRKELEAQIGALQAQVSEIENEQVALMAADEEDEGPKGLLDLIRMLQGK